MVLVVVIVVLVVVATMTMLVVLVIIVVMVGVIIQRCYRTHISHDQTLGTTKNVTTQRSAHAHLIRRREGQIIRVKKS